MFFWVQQNRGIGLADPMRIVQHMQLNMSLFLLHLFGFSGISRFALGGLLCEIRFKCSQALPSAISNIIAFRILCKYINQITSYRIRL